MSGRVRGEEKGEDEEEEGREEGGKGVEGETMFPTYFIYLHIPLFSSIYLHIPSYTPNYSHTPSSLEDGLFANLLIFDHLHYIFV